MRSVWLFVVIALLGVEPARCQIQPFIAKRMNTKSLKRPADGLIPLKEALAELAEAYRINFIYEDALISGRKTHQLRDFSKDFHKDLQKLLSGKPLSYSIVGNRTVVLIPIVIPPRLKRTELSESEAAWRILK